MEQVRSLSPFVWLSIAAALTTIALKGGAYWRQLQTVKVSASQIPRTLAIHHSPAYTHRAAARPREIGPSGLLKENPYSASQETMPTTIQNPVTTASTPGSRNSGPAALPSRRLSRDRG